MLTHAVERLKQRRRARDCEITGDALSIRLGYSMGGDKARPLGVELVFENVALARSLAIEVDEEVEHGRAVSHQRAVVGLARVHVHHIEHDIWSTADGSPCLRAVPECRDHDRSAIEKDATHEGCHPACICTLE